MSEEMRSNGLSDPILGGFEAKLVLSSFERELGRLAFNTDSVVWQSESRKMLLPPLDDDRWFLEDHHVGPLSFGPCSLKTHLRDDSLRQAPGAALFYSTRPYALVSHCLEVISLNRIQQAGSAAPA